MEKLILIKYGELTTKKSNRNVFIKKLEQNIKKLLQSYDYSIIKDISRMYIKTKNTKDIIKDLNKIFGIHSISVCYKTNNNIKDVLAVVLKLINNDVNTFKVETKRADKKFPIKSMDFSAKLGELILDNTHLKVDVKNPDIIIYVEIRIDGTYIYTNNIKCSGGYPVGIQGKGLLMLSGGIDSPVAGYLSLKRGIDIDCLYFDSPPHTSQQAKDKVNKLKNILNQYSGNIKLFIVPFTQIQEAIYKNVPHDYMITIMRRMMYRIADQFCQKNHNKVIINGESIGQVASQTLDSMICINEVTTRPVIRPVACFDKLEIIDIAKKIKTYETSILPYEDCCTIFVPKHPVINPILEKCLKFEKNFDYQELIMKCVDNIVLYQEQNKYKDIL